MKINEKEICSLYDEAEENKKRDQIRALAKMYDTSFEDVETILKENGRVIPDPRPKAEIKERQLPMPDIVKDIISAELDKIDHQIEEHKKELRILEQNYKTISDYMKRNE